ncbi:MAG: pentapeptide repeat-containing protein [Cyanobacteria bacterium J06641_5]
MQQATAAEILQRYAKGDRDFQRLSLQGANFQGTNLADANFSDCELQGANFGRANLTGANFREAKAGLQKNPAIALVVVAVLLAGLFAFVAALFAAVLSFYVFDPNSLATRPERIAFGFVIAATYLTFVFVSVRGSIASAFGALVLAGTVALFGALAGAGTGAGAVAVAIVVAAVGATAVAVAIAAAGAIAGTSAASAAAAIAIVGALSIAAGGSTAIALLEGGAVVGAVAGSVPMTLLGAYLGWRTLKNDPRDPWFRDCALRLPASFGTRFFQANLTNADFSGAHLKNANFHKAVLYNANFRNARKLHLARPGNSYLRSIPILNLLVTGTLRAYKNFNRLNLQGIDLSDLDLSDASFIAANLTDADLSNTNLTRAKFVQTQLDRANLHRAILTGATIEDWHISPATNLNDIHCDYVFLRLPPEKRPVFIAALANTDPKDRRRKPTDWDRNFAPGEFVASIAPLPQTLDLYHDRVGDLRAVALALEKLRNDNPSAQLEPLVFEFRGTDNRDILIKVKLSSTKDSSDLHRQYFQIYDTLKGLPVEQLQALLEAGHARDRQLVALLSTAAIAPEQ